MKIWQTLYLNEIILSITHKVTVAGCSKKEHSTIPTVRSDFSYGYVLILYYALLKWTHEKKISRQVSDSCPSIFICF